MNLKSNPLHRITITCGEKDSFRLIDEQDAVWMAINTYKYLPGQTYAIHIDRLEHGNGDDYDWVPVQSIYHVTQNVFIG